MMDLIMVYIKQTEHKAVELHTEANVFQYNYLQGCAYVQGYRTERISTTYKDVDKPRTFVTEMNKTCCL